MQTAATKSETKPSSSMPATAKAPDIASASVPDTLAALQVNPETGLTRGEVETCRKEHGYNEVAEQKEHPVLKFLGKFWGLSGGDEVASEVLAGKGLCSAAAALMIPWLLVRIQPGPMTYVEA